MVAGHAGAARTADAVAFHSADLLAQPHFVRFYSRDQLRRRDPTAALVIHSSTGARHVEAMGRHHEWRRRKSDLR